jgi:hypothetical protein
MRVSVARKVGLGFASLVGVMTVYSLVVYQKVISIRMIEERIIGLRWLSSLSCDLQNLVGRFQLGADGEEPETSTAAYGEGVPLRQLKTC